MRPLLHDSRLLAQLGPMLFNASCTIEAKSVTHDDANQEVETWAAVAALQNLSCTLDEDPELRGRFGSVEDRNDNVSLQKVTHRIVLAGRYPAITLVHRAVVTDFHGNVFTGNIVLRGGQDQNPLTILYVEAITP